MKYAALSLAAILSLHLPECNNTQDTTTTQQIRQTPIIHTYDPCSKDLPSASDMYECSRKQVKTLQDSLYRSTSSYQDRQ